MKLSIFYKSMSPTSPGYLQKNSTIRVFAKENHGGQKTAEVLQGETTFDLAPYIGKKEQPLTLPLINYKVQKGHLKTFISIITAKEAQQMGVDPSDLLEQNPNDQQRAMSMSISQNEKRPELKEESKGAFEENSQPKYTQAELDHETAEALSQIIIQREDIQTQTVNAENFVQTQTKVTTHDVQTQTDLFEHKEIANHDQQFEDESRQTEVCISKPKINEEQHQELENEIKRLTHLLNMALTEEPTDQYKKAKELGRLMIRLEQTQDQVELLEKKVAELNLENQKLKHK